jgi:KUP system potassium uptake protein
LGARQVALHPEILAAINPLRGLEVLHSLGLTGTLRLLGGVVLAITGGEALYADMGTSASDRSA